MTGRTTAEVLRDPAHVDLVRQADDAFARAERAASLEESFAAFSEGMTYLRQVNDAERAREAELQAELADVETVLDLVRQDHEAG